MSDEYLPIEIFCRLEYVGLDAEGNVVLVFSKKNKQYIHTLVNVLKNVIGNEVYVRLDYGKWI